MSPVKLNTNGPSDPERDAMIADMQRDQEEKRRAAEGIRKAREEQGREVQAVAQAMSNAILLFYQGKTGEQFPRIDGYVLLHASLNLIGSHAVHLEREAQCQYLGAAIALLAGPLHTPVQLPDPSTPGTDGQEPEVQVVSEPH